MRGSNHIQFLATRQINEKRMDTFHYKGFTGSIENSVEDQCLYGKLLGIGDLILYEADSIDKLEIEFKEAVDDYLITRRNLAH